MAGHSKWANIKHRKGAQDARRSKIFTRIIKELTIASRDGGPDPETNPALRLAMQNAKGANMPKDTMERAIKKGQGDDSGNLQAMTFEGYGPNGIAMFVEATTDNQNRTVASVRSIFNKFDGNLGTNGSLSFIFDAKGVFTITREALGERDLDELEMELIDGGLESMERLEDKVVLYTTFEDFGKMQSKLEEMKIDTENAEIQRVPKITNALPLDQAQTILKMIDKFEEDDDVNTVYHDMELTDELVAELEKE